MHKSKSSKYVSDQNRYEAIIKILDIGPELNIFTIISTQSSDKDILTKKILDNCQTRLAFRTINAQDSRRILKNQQSIHERDHILIMASAVKFSRYIVYHCVIVDTTPTVYEIS